MSVYLFLLSKYNYMHEKLCSAQGFLYINYLDLFKTTNILFQNF